MTCGVLAAYAHAAQPRPQLSAAVRAYVSVDAPVIALTHVRVIDGTGAAPREDQTLIMRDGNIAAIGSFASTPVPEGAHDDRSHRQERDSRPRDGARASLLPERSRRLRTARRKLFASLSLRRRHDDADRRQRQRVHGPEHDAAGRGGPEAGTRDRCHRAVSERPEHVHPDAHAERPGGRAAAGAVLDRRRRDVAQDLHADHARRAGGGDQRSAPARHQGHRPSLLGHLRGSGGPRHRQSRARLLRRHGFRGRQETRSVSRARASARRRSPRSTRTARRSRRWCRR